MELPFIEFWYQHLESDYQRKLDSLYEDKKTKTKKSKKKKT